MSKTSRAATPKSVATPKGVVVEECSLDDAKPISVGDLVYMPFKRVHNITLGRDTQEVRQVKPFDCNVQSFIHACLYKFGGADGDCVGDAKVWRKNAEGKKVSSRAMTKAERVAMMDKRFRAITDGTYIGVGKARGIPIPERLAEAVLIVQAQIKADRAWVESFYTPVRSRAMTEKDAMISLATSLSSHGKNKVATPERVAKVLAKLEEKVTSNLASRVEFEWDDADDDLVE